MKSSRGGSNLPRFFVTLGKEIIFDYPKQFAYLGLSDYPYVNDVGKFSDLIRQYIDTPIAELLGKRFADDKWGLTQILKAADKRIGLRRLSALLLQTDSESAKRIIQLRLSF